MNCEKMIAEKIRELQHVIHQFADQDEMGFPVLSNEIRWDLHVLACSINDSTLWVRKSTEFPGYSECTEVETGVTTWGANDSEAVNNYFIGNFDKPGDD